MSSPLKWQPIKFLAMLISIKSSTEWIPINQNSLLRTNFCTESLKIFQYRNLFLTITGKVDSDMKKN